MSFKLSRRDFLKITATVASGTALFGIATRFATPSIVTCSASKFLLGTVINLTLIAPSETLGQVTLEKTFTEIERLARIFSRFDPSSELSRLNQHQQLANPSPELQAVLKRAQDWHAVTNGAFDVTVLPLLTLYEQAHESALLPTTAEIANALTQIGMEKIKITPQQIALAHAHMSLTLDGIAKGYIIDASVQLLNNLGYTDVLVEAGGDLYAQGQKPVQKWQVGIKSPSSGGLAARFALVNRGAATSGDYQQAFTADRQAHHIIDPRTGQSPLEVSSATVLAPTAMDADALATAAMVLGIDASLNLARDLEGYALYLINKLGQVAYTPNFPL